MGGLASELSGWRERVELLLAGVQYAGLGLAVITVGWFTLAISGDMLGQLFQPLLLVERTVAGLVYPTAWFGLLGALAAWSSRSLLQAAASARTWAFLVPVGFSVVLWGLPAGVMVPVVWQYVLLTVFAAVVGFAVSLGAMAARGVANVVVGVVGAVASFAVVAVVVFGAFFASEQLRAALVVRTVTSPSRMIQALGVERHAEQVLLSSGGAIVGVRGGCPRSAVYCTSLAEGRDLPQVMRRMGFGEDAWERRVLPAGTEARSLLFGDLLLVLVEGRTSVGVTVVDVTTDLERDGFRFRMGE